MATKYSKLQPTLPDMKVSIKVLRDMMIHFACSGPMGAKLAREHILIKKAKISCEEKTDACLVGNVYCEIEDEKLASKFCAVLSDDINIGTFKPGHGYLWTRAGVLNKPKRHTLLRCLKLR